MEMQPSAKSSAPLRELSAQHHLVVGLATIGCMYKDVSEDEAIATVHAALDAGVCSFDVAPAYGCGLAEARLGAALREYFDPVTDLADVVAVSTKCGYLVGDAMQADHARIESMDDDTFKHHKYLPGESPVKLSAFVSPYSARQLLFARL